ncbi:TrbG/VirB9 family P-type conjugative transfer protein [Marinivivus vitaminiproducens]|uniref:TrbG/VirB9 family P-type conjugative transfer protein n=1 Tax=Marinivivus vitaminiproducens TaxID=3035935 RepID=UPI0027A3A4BA|nr:TrbG/VirB9 family P-type conjugative transfer protein [Geminicoccaceae bacterium SCSIO 64248]
MRSPSLPLATAMLLLAACNTNSGVDTSPDYVPARPAERVPQLESAVQREARAPRLRGARAVDKALRAVTIQPTDLAIQGNTWIIDDVDPRSVYLVPTAPLSPTTILLPLGEALTSAVSGSTEDFTVGTAQSGDRAAITIMPNCANPKTERFAEDGDTPLVRCMTATAKSTFITSGGVYHFLFPVYDWTAVAQVEVNKAPPPPTNPYGTTRPPFPSAAATPLFIERTGAWRAPWAPVQAYADPDKLVIEFRKPVSQLPGLYVGLEGEAMVNYRTIDTPSALYLVTDRRVTEAELRIDDQVVTLTAGRGQVQDLSPQQVRAPQSVSPTNRGARERRDHEVRTREART